MKHVISMVQKKTGSDLSVSQQNRPLGGTYVKLEQEWKEHLKQRSYALGLSTSATQVNTACNNIALNVKNTRRKPDSGGQ